MSTCKPKNAKQNRSLLIGEVVKITEGTEEGGRFMSSIATDQRNYILRQPVRQPCFCANGLSMFIVMLWFAIPSTTPRSQTTTPRWRALPTPATPSAATLTSDDERHYFYPYHRSGLFCSDKSTMPVAPTGIPVYGPQKSVRSRIAIRVLHQCIINHHHHHDCCYCRL